MLKEVSHTGEEDDLEFMLAGRLPKWGDVFQALWLRVEIIDVPQLGQCDQDGLPYSCREAERAALFTLTSSQLLRSNSLNLIRRFADRLTRIANFLSLGLFEGMFRVVPGGPVAPVCRPVGVILLPLGQRNTSPRFQELHRVEADCLR